MADAKPDGTVVPQVPEMSLRDWLAINATENDVWRHRQSEIGPNGELLGFCYTIEQARYKYADAMLHARAGRVERDNS